MVRRNSAVAALTALLALGFVADADAATLTLAWDPSVNAIGYVVMYGTRSGSYTNQMDVGAVTQIPIAGLKDGTTYYFSVKAYAANGVQSTPSTEISGTTPAVPPSSYFGFSGLGKPSFIWQRTDGYLQSWFLNGTTATQLVVLNPASVTDPNWRVVGSADFDNDGYPDLVFQHAISAKIVIWYMHGTQMTSGVWMSPAGPSDTNWKVAGVADFNGDGHPDLLMQNAISGGLVVWYLNGPTLIGASWFNPAGPSDPGYKVVGIGDFNGDGSPDLLFQHQTTAKMAVWYANGATMTGAALLSPSAPTDTNWRVAGLMDADGDGQVDIIVRHRLSGGVMAWFMNGVTVSSTQWFTPTGLSDLTWNIVAIK